MENAVTVCIATYNRKELLKAALQSVLNQTYPDFEIIIVDDCSTDGTEKYVKEELLSLDKRIRYIRHEKNRGLAAARNTAIFNAKGRYFTFIDDDDQWNENFLQRMVEIAQDRDERFIFCASTISDNQIEKVDAIEAKLKDLLIEGFTPPVGSQFYFTKTLREIGGYDERIKSGVDHDLWITLGLYDINVVWINENYIEVNATPSDNRMTFNLEKRIKGIADSLKIWENRVKEAYGKDFFSCLEKNYRYNTYKKFLMNRRDILTIWDFVAFWRKLPKDLFLKDLWRYTQNRLGKRRLLRKPLFMKCGRETKNAIFFKKIILRNDIP